MVPLTSQLRIDYPDISFIEGDRASWSAATQTVTFVPHGDKHETYALLHELGHGLLGHQDFDSDVDLLRKETAAWQKARELAPTYNIDLDENHVQDCLDTYRDWLHKRSTCVHCHSHGIQKNMRTYVCLNCGSQWHVTSNRLCRPYRRHETPEAI